MSEAVKGELQRETGSVAFATLPVQQELAA